ncbi:hypothetical protein BC936DRAFT_141941 [Jimgerdemannia flammicorona]|uniref:UBX domain-containing protein n=1 Tax=Jimgerdemannia flammicorona TaxID=994334 RepID=A0A433A1D5_9FUNG|nr:hypothetical protein BC936DRAFT_141941 [Jimgerdemannia flammicorona]
MSAANEKDEQLRKNNFKSSPDDISVRFILLDGSFISQWFKKTDTLTNVYDRLDRGFNRGGAIYTLSHGDRDLTDLDDNTLEALGIHDDSQLIMNASSAA